MTKNVTWRIERPVTVTRAERVAHDRCAETRAVAAAACVPATVLCGAGWTTGAGAGVAVGVGVGGGAGVVVTVVGGGAGVPQTRSWWSSAGESGARTLRSDVSVAAHYENASIVWDLPSSSVYGTCRLPVRPICVVPSRKVALSTVTSNAPCSDRRRTPST